MFNKFLIVMMISALSLYGCGGGSGTTTVTDTPTDTSLVFSIFAPEYLGGNYSISYSLAGSDTNGDSYSATQSVQSGNPSMVFVGKKAVKVIDVSTSITNTSTNALIEITDNKYFIHEEHTNIIKYYGYYHDYNASYTYLVIPKSDTSINVIPLTATIGDFGIVGEYINSGGSYFTQSWKLTDGFNGKAKLIVTTVPSDTSSNLYPTTIEKLLISQDGTVSGFELIVTYHQSGNTITLTSL